MPLIIAFCEATVFPAHAGMSRTRRELGHHLAGFPRPRGDEPLFTMVMDIRTAFSPPTRG